MKLICKLFDIQRRLKLEQEYAAHRRRLAEDWKRLEQQEQETLASLQSKEKDLKKRRELLEWEVDQEMNQVRCSAFFRILDFFHFLFLQKFA